MTPVAWSLKGGDWKNEVCGRKPDAEEKNQNQVRNPILDGERQLDSHFWNHDLTFHLCVIGTLAEGEWAVEFKKQSVLLRIDDGETLPPKL